ncbi:MAG: molybdopterin synthase sulfur carrier subunit [Cytophagales bacterium]|nr:MAG: molybdopterin synthase sulfur carrier subunit [Cytophagales bacterium]TAF59475.1 MAG: molybdopterin synthase sulfur carrier subunit [Cytophagales bacterium]
MKITVLFFGITKDIAQTDKLELNAADFPNLGVLRAHLLHSYPALGSLKSLAWAHNQTYTHDFLAQLVPNDEVALLPPVSGG